MPVRLNDKTITSKKEHLERLEAEASGKRECMSKLTSRQLSMRQRVNEMRSREAGLMAELDSAQFNQSIACPHCLRKDLWLPFRRHYDEWMPDLIRCHCNHCGCEWNPFFKE